MGRVVTMQDNLGAITIKANDELAEEYERQAKVLAEKNYRATLPYRYRQATTDLEYKPSDILVLSGGVGSGKTYTACGILAKLMRGKYYTMYDIVNTLANRTFGGMEKASDMRCDLYNASVLVIDEVGRGGTGEDALLFEIVNERYNRCRGVILVTNLDKKSFVEKFGEPLLDRIIECGSWQDFGNESRRKKMRGEK